ncbi:MAG: diaminopimelate epimerase [Bacteroidota bacterium]
MLIHFSKYEGTGNDFIIINNRNKVFNSKNFSLIQKLCNRRFGIGADGLLLLNTSEKYNYNMEYFNADGKLGSMCGNGGRCLAAFAKRLGLINEGAIFDAIDGIHYARVEKFDEKKFNAIVNLKMNNVKEIERGEGYSYLNTGSPHYVAFVDDPDRTDVIAEGRRIRYNERFREDGTNVNFINYKKDKIYIRTYERGVEDETLSCGTGAVASVLAVADKGLLGGKLKGELITKGGTLVVSFEKTDNGFENVFLEGPATFVFDGEIEIGN